MRESKITRKGKVLSMDLTTVFAVATTLAIITACLLEVLKRATNMEARYVPLLALVIGILLGVAATPIADLTIPELLWAGAISGFMASGIFSTVKQTLGGKKDDNGDDSSRD